MASYTAAYIALLCAATLPLHSSERPTHCRCRAPLLPLSAGGVHTWRLKFWLNSGCANRCYLFENCRPWQLDWKAGLGRLRGWQACIGWAAGRAGIALQINATQRNLNTCIYAGRQAQAAHLASFPAASANCR